jgi:hypothetical protein
MAAPRRPRASGDVLKQDDGGEAQGVSQLPGKPVNPGLEETARGLEDVRKGRVSPVKELKARYKGIRPTGALAVTAQR